MFAMTVRHSRTRSKKLCFDGMEPPVRKCSESAPGGTDFSLSVLDPSHGQTKVCPTLPLAALIQNEERIIANRPGIPKSLSAWFGATLARNVSAAFARSDSRA